MLSYEEFEWEFKKALEEKYPDAKIIRKSQYKFNKIKNGFMIEGKGNVHPIVYTEDFYEVYQRFEEMDLVLDSIDAAVECDKMNAYKELVKDWEHVKEYIYPYIVNMDKNQSCMDCHDYVYKQKLDFAYSVYVEIVDDDGIACVNITHDLLRLWSVSEEEVFAIAEKNAKYSVKPMRQIIGELMGKDFSEEDCLENEAMYVVTNKTKNRGAAGIFDFDLLRKTAEELQSDFYILPSSLHEIILVLEKEAPSKQSLKEMVADVNQCQVKEEEFLSDNVYFYSKEENQVKIVEMD